MNEGKGDCLSHAVAHAISEGADKQKTALKVKAMVAGHLARHSASPDRSEPKFAKGVWGVPDYVKAVGTQGAGVRSLGAGSDDGHVRQVDLHPAAWHGCGEFRHLRPRKHGKHEDADGAVVREPTRRDGRGAGAPREDATPKAPTGEGKRTPHARSLAKLWTF